MKGVDEDVLAHVRLRNVEYRVVGGAKKVVYINEFSRVRLHAHVIMPFYDRRMPPLPLSQAARAARAGQADRADGAGKADEAGGAEVAGEAHEADGRGGEGGGEARGGDAGGGSDGGGGAAGLSTWPTLDPIVGALERSRWAHAAGMNVVVSVISRVLGLGFRV
jgi:uncharacterized membrane protein YgcG